MAKQRELFASATYAVDPEFSRCTRRELSAGCWIDVQKQWVTGADVLFEEVFAARTWGQRERWMYGSKVREPRLTSHWSSASNQPLTPAMLETIRLLLSARYDVTFESLGFNLYRDGEDSVAWHVDRIAKQVSSPVIALVSLGAPRRFLLRPKGGGPSVALDLGDGDLLVGGGGTQREWEHSIPKVAHAEPRISIAFRYNLDPSAYAHKTTVEPDRIV